MRQESALHRIRTWILGKIQHGANPRFESQLDHITTQIDATIIQLNGEKGFGFPEAGFC